MMLHDMAKMERPILSEWCCKRRLELLWFFSSNMEVSSASVEPNEDCSPSFSNYETLIYIQRISAESATSSYFA